MHHAPRNRIGSSRTVLVLHNLSHTLSWSPMSEFIIVPIRNYEKMKNLELWKKKIRNNEVPPGHGHSRVSLGPAAMPDLYVPCRWPSLKQPYSWASIIQPSPTSLDTPRHTFNQKRMHTLLIECISIKFPASKTLGVVVFVEKCANNLMNYITQIELKQGLFI